MIALFTTGSALAQETKDKFEVQVDGLGCPFCAYGLEKKFKEFKGIDDVKIDIETGNFSFTYPSSKELTMDAVENQVVKAGYTPITSKISRADGTIESSEDSNSSLTANAQLTDSSLFVAGNCGMCEARIVKAATDVDGVANAAWDKDTKMLEVKFDKAQTTVNDIAKNVAKVGHDTKQFQASATSYASLPGCCKYERVNQ